MTDIREREYWPSSWGAGIDASALKSQDEDTKIEVMRDWFLQMYETPEENTPYDSGEGGYIYIWGGPYDPKEILEGEFNDIVSGATINKLSEELAKISSEWSGKPGSGDFSDFFIKEISGIDFYANFRSASKEIAKLMEAKVPPKAKACLNRLLFANVITAMEAFLSDAFITTVLNEPSAMRKLIETTPRFQKEKVLVSEIYIQMEGIKNRASEYLGETIWHNLHIVREMYRSTLGIEFPRIFNDIIPAVLIRHDIVHRNGKTKTGTERQISVKDIAKLLDRVEAFVLRVNTELGARKVISEEKDKKKV